MKRRIALLLAVVMILGTFSVAFAESAVENPGEFLEEKGVLKGDLDGNLNLDKPLERRDAVIMLSRLLGVEKEAKAFEEEGLPTWKDITDDNYKGYLAWAQSNKYFQGHNEERFGFRDDITVKEYAVVLMRALGYVEEAGDWKAAYDKAVELGLLEGVEKEADVKVLRGEMAQMTVNALETKVKDSEETLAEKLEIEMPVPEKLEVKEVKADNLKEIKIIFNKDVDKDNVEDKAIYTTDAGSIKDAKLYDGYMVVLTLEDGVEMENKEEYKLNIRGLVEGDSAVNSEFKFVAIDNSIPEVVEVVGLGTKAVKVVMSEPVKNVKSSSFKVDGKTYYGSTEVTGREIILKPYGSDFSVGTHTLVVKSLEDYEGFKSVETEIEFEIIEDKEAPTVEDVKGTLERVVVTFSEDVDGVTVTRDSLYWGGNKSNKADKVVRLSGNRFAFEFSEEKALPTYEVSLTISGVKDYSGNEMKSVERAFRAEIDQTRPEVLDVKVKDGNKIEVRFNKTIYGEDLKERDNFVLVDKDGKKVSLRAPEVDDKDSRLIIVKLYSELEEDEDYTLKISGLRDNTKLRNSMLPYEEVITAGSFKKPEADETVIPNAADRELQVTFNKKMDVETISDPANYLIVLNASKGPEYQLSVIKGKVDVVQDGKAVILTLPKEFDDIDMTESAGFDKVKYVKVLGVKDVAGNVLSNYGEELKVEKAELKVEKATATDSRTIEVKFNHTVVNAERSNFEVSNYTIDRVKTNGTKKVVIELVDKKDNELKADLTGESVVVKGKIETVLGKYDVSQTLTKADDFVDEIKPTIVKVTGTVGGDNKELKLVLEFDEALDTDYGHLAKRDLKVKRTDGETLDMNKATTTIVGKEVILTTEELVDKAKAYEVDTIETPGAIRDIANNPINKFKNVELVEGLGTHETEAEADVAKAEAVKAKITALPAEDELTIEDKEAVEAAQEAYEGLTEAQKALVDNHAVLEAAVVKIGELEDAADAAKANEVKDAIAALPAEDELVLGNKATVAIVRAAYEGLTEAQQELVTNVDKLEAAEAKIAELEATAAVEKAEESKLQADVDAAQALVEALPDGDVKTALQGRIEAIEVAEP